jgi:hypothetical protein
MNEHPEEERRSPTGAERGGIEAEPDHLAETEAWLVRGLERALADGRLDMGTFGCIDLQGLARRLAYRSEAGEPSPARTVRWMKGLDRRLRRLESRLEALESQAASQREAIGMMGALLQDLDDPYGLGRSLDERLARDGSDRAPEDG